MTEGSTHRRPCPRCGGIGTVALDQCQAVVGPPHRRRQCSKPILWDDDYFTDFPERAWQRDYCRFHGHQMFHKQELWLQMRGSTGTDQHGDDLVD